MGIEYPAALWWSLLAIPVVLLYLSLQSKREAVSTALLWRRALARRTLWQRMRRPVSLGLQLLFLFLVIAALAEPYHLNGRQVAFWLILAATVLTVLEWGLFQRRVTV
jgi:hypothetical protein